MNNRYISALIYNNQSGKNSNKLTTQITKYL